MSLSNYPDDFDHSLLSGEGEEEEENTCEHEEFELDDSVAAHIDDIMNVIYYCNSCGAQGTITHKISLIDWVDGES